MRYFRDDVRENIQRLYPEIGAKNVDSMIKSILSEASEELGKTTNLLAQ